MSVGAVGGFGLLLSLQDVTEIWYQNEMAAEKKKFKRDIPTPSREDVLEWGVGAYARSDGGLECLCDGTYLFIHHAHEAAPVGGRVIGTRRTGARHSNRHCSR